MEGFNGIFRRSLLSLNLVVLLGCIIILDVSTLKGVLFLNMIVGAMQLLIHVGYGFHKLFQLKIKHKLEL